MEPTLSMKYIFVFLIIKYFLISAHKQTVKNSRIYADSESTLSSDSDR